MTFYNFFLKLSFITILVACQSSESLKRESRPEYYTNELMKTESFFLPRAPEYLRFSYEGKCFYSDEVERLDFKKLEGTYNLGLEKLVELQAFYNSERIKNRTKDKNLLLYEVIEKISGNVRFFDYPKYKKYNFIWVDGLSETERAVWLKKYINSRHMEDGVPIVMSQCLSSNSLNEFLNKTKLSDDLPYVLGSEIYHNYSNEFEYLPYFHSELSSAFLENSKFKIVKSSYKRNQNFKGLNLPDIPSELTYK